MLSYLVSSKAKELLLKLLWVEEARGSVRELSKLSGLSYSMTYDELKKMYDAGLVKFERLGNTLLYSSNEVATSESRALRTLLGRPSVKIKTMSQEDVLWHLVNQLQAPLPKPLNAPKVNRVSNELLLSYALKYSHLNPSLARVLPVLFSKSVQLLNFNKLEFEARQLNEERSLGFFLELTSLLSKDSDLKLLASRFMDRRRSKLADYFYGNKGAFEIELTRKNTPKLAIKWHFLMNMGLDSFKTTFEKNVT